MFSLDSGLFPSQCSNPAQDPGSPGVVRRCLWTQWLPVLQISFFLTWSNDCLWPHAGEGFLRDGYIRRVGQDVSICYKFILKQKGRALFHAHVSVIEIRTLPQQSVKKLIKINFVTKN